MDPLQESAAYQLLGDGPQVVIQDHDVITVPANAATDVQENLVQEQHD